MNHYHVIEIDARGLTDFQALTKWRLLSDRGFACDWSDDNNTIVARRAVLANGSRSHEKWLKLRTDLRELEQLLANEPNDNERS